MQEAKKRNESVAQAGDTSWRVPVIIAFAFAFSAAIGLGVGVGIENAKSSPLQVGNTNSQTPAAASALPLVTPPVKAAVPVGLKVHSGASAHVQTLPRPIRTLSQHVHASSRGMRTLALDTTDIQSRFFNANGGPTNMFDILEGVDGRIQGINPRLATQFAACMASTPTPFTLTTWGTNVPFYSQCSEGWNGNVLNGFDQWAVVNGTFYLYVRGGDGEVAAQVSGYNATHGPTHVLVWYSVGVINRNGSHGVVQVLAQPLDGIFEMTAAGAGIGYCGAQLRSNNATINVTGSADMGATCTVTDSACISAVTLQTASNCAPVSFVLPALGRKANAGAGWGASQWPGSARNQVHITLNTTDDTFFGPTAPTS